MAIGMKNAAPRKDVKSGAIKRTNVERNGAGKTAPKSRNSNLSSTKNKRASAEPILDEEVELDDYDDTENKNNNSGNKNVSNTTLIVVGVVALIVVAIAVIVVGSKNKESANDEEDLIINTEYSEPIDTTTYLYDDEGNPVYDSNGNIIGEDTINPGYSDSTNTFMGEGGLAPAEVYSPDDYIKDLNGVNISAVYNVEAMNTVVDYVNYIKKRAIIEDGMEMFWLEVVYEGKKYRTQVPFSTFRFLKDEGICKVEMEVLDISGGGKIISYMKVLNEDGTSM